jgi:hypothetical protein
MRRGWRQTRSGKGVHGPAFKPLQTWEGLRKKSQGFKPDPGNLAVRDYRGASGNVSHGGTVHPSCNRKSRNGTPPPTAGRARLLSHALFRPVEMRRAAAAMRGKPPLHRRLCRLPSRFGGSSIAWIFCRSSIPSSASSVAMAPLLPMPNGRKSPTLRSSPSRRG